MRTHRLELRYPAGWESISRGLGGSPGRIALLCGASGIFTLGLALAGATRQPFAVIDGAMRFNSYTLSRIAASLGMPPKELLRRTHVTRSFTAYQTEAAITLKLPRFLQGRPGCTLVVILGLLDTYYDEQVSPQECRGSIERVLEAVRQLASTNVHVLITDTEVSNAPAGKEILFPMLRAAADMVVTLDTTEGRYALISSGRESGIRSGADLVPSSPVGLMDKQTKTSNAIQIYR